MTRSLAQEWAGKAIRFNAIAPQVAQLPGDRAVASEPDVAALASYLASGHGKELSGHVFEAERAF
jgi:NAD(P)-dependent dehydrogenase (short-subunit alcohol dehydrogenase family)